MEYIAQLVRYSRACCSYQEWLDRELWITRNYWTKWFIVIRLIYDFDSFTTGIMTWLTVTGSVIDDHWYVAFVVVTFPFCRFVIIITPCTTSEGTTCSSEKDEFTLVFFWCGSRYSIFSFLCIILSTIVGRFVLYLLVSIVSVLWFKASDYIFCIFKHFCDVK